MQRFLTSLIHIRPIIITLLIGVGTAVYRFIEPFSTQVVKMTFGDSLAITYNRMWDIPTIMVITFFMMRHIKNGRIGKAPWRTSNSAEELIEFHDVGIMAWIAGSAFTLGMGWLPGLAAVALVTVLLACWMIIRIINRITPWRWLLTYEHQLVDTTKPTRREAVLPYSTQVPTGPVWGERN